MSEIAKKKVYLESSFFGYLMNKSIALPLTNAVIVSAGYKCPTIMTPVDFLEEQEAING